MRPGTAIQPRPHNEPAPLSFSQRRLWYLEQLNPGTPTYNAPYAFYGRGMIDPDLLRTAVNRLLERHRVLRTRIGITPQGEPCCELAATWNAVEGINVSGEHSQQDARRLLEAEAQRPFDLARDLMLRVLLILCGTDEFYLLFTAHHIAWDGISKVIFFRELAVIYDTLLEGNTLVEQSGRIDYGDFAYWQQRTFTGRVREREIEYWRGKLGDAAPWLELPLDRPRPATQRFHGAKVMFVLVPGLLEGAQELARDEKTTLYTTLLTAFKVFLLAFTSQEDISVATPFAGRDEPEAQDVIGFFTNTAVLRTQLQPAACFRELMGRVRETLWGAQEHGRMPMDQLVDLLQKPRDLSRMPLAQVNFRLQPGKPAGLRLGKVECAPLPLIDTCISKFDLALEIASSESETGYLEYNTDLFDAERMEQLPPAFGDLLGALLAAPACPVGALPAFQAVACLRPQRRRIGMAPASSRRVHA